MKGHLTHINFCATLGGHSDFQLLHLRQTHILQGISFYLTNLLSPWCTVLLEQVTVSQPVKKFSAFYGTRMFITALTSAQCTTCSPYQSPKTSFPQYILYEIRVMELEMIWEMNQAVDRASYALNLFFASKKNIQCVQNYFYKLIIG